MNAPACVNCINIIGNIRSDALWATCCHTLTYFKQYWIDRMWVFWQVDEMKNVRLNNLVDVTCWNTIKLSKLINKFYLRMLKMYVRNMFILWYVMVFSDSKIIIFHMLKKWHSSGLLTTVDFTRWGVRSWVIYFVQWPLDTVPNCIEL